MSEPLRLEIKGGPLSNHIQVILGGVDISRHTTGFTVISDADNMGLITAELSLVNMDAQMDGEVVVKGAKCFMCGKPATHWVTRTVETTGMGDNCKTYRSLGRLPFCDLHIPGVQGAMEADGL